MKVLFLQDDFPPRSFGGAGFSTYELAREMVRAGINVSVVTTCRKKHEEGVLEYEGIRVWSVYSQYNLKWRMFKSVRNYTVLHRVGEILNEVKPDIVHINNVHLHLSYGCFSLAKRYAKGVVFTARDTMSFYFSKLSTPQYVHNGDTRITFRDHLRLVRGRYNPFYFNCARRAIMLADYRVAVSNALKGALESNGITPVSVIHTGVTLDDWSVTQEAIEKFKEAYGLSERKIIVFSGRLSEGKGGDASLQALVHVVQEVPDAVLLIVGGVDVYGAMMQKRAQELGISDKIIMTDWIPREKAKVAYAAADVVWVPSRYLDPFPRVVLEAMALGKPVVGTCYGGAPELIRHGETGFVVNPNAASEIGKKTVELLKNDVLRTQFGDASRKRVQEQFNLKEKVKEYLALYQTLL